MNNNSIEELVIPESLITFNDESENNIISWENELISFFADKYELFTPFSEYFKTRGYEFRIMRQLLPSYFDLNNKYENVLEIGCGFGFKSLLLSNWCNHVLGVDIPLKYESHVMSGYNSSVEIAKIIVNQKFNIGNVNFKEMYPNNIDLEDNSVSLIFSEYTLEHVPDLASSIKEMNRVLSNNGLMIHVVPNANLAFHEFVNAQINISFKDFVNHLWKKYKNQYTPIRSSGNGNIIPPNHSEFIGMGDYSEQIKLYMLENYLFPMIEVGLVIEKVISTREYNYVIVARKKMKDK